MKLLPTTVGARWRLACLGAVFCVVFGCQVAIPAAGRLGYHPQEGDFVFQSLPHGDLVEAIEGSTGSPYSHCGIVSRRNGRWVVIEAIGPVKETPLFAWIRRGRGSFFDAFRLRPEFQPRVPAMVAAGRGFLGRPYDIHYELDDGKIYCSELIWKAYRQAGGGDLGALTALGQLDWRPHQAVIRRIEGGGLPLDRRMITPRAVAESAPLERVFSFRAPRGGE